MNVICPYALKPKGPKWLVSDKHLFYDDKCAIAVFITVLIKRTLAPLPKIITIVHSGNEFNNRLDFVGHLNNLPLSEH